MSSRCPTCKQEIRTPGPRRPTRICYDCGNPIALHHKYTFEERHGATILVHRVCCNPDSYFRAAKCKKEGVVGYSHYSKEQVHELTRREDELEEGFRKWRIANGHAKEEDFL